jgi:hypothetical protein
MTGLVDSGGFADGLKRTVFRKRGGAQKTAKSRDTVAAICHRLPQPDSKADS